MRRLCLVEKHLSPGGSSLSFSAFQRPLRTFHEKTLWWQERGDTYLLEFPGHTPRSRAKRPVDAGIKASDSKAAQRLVGDVSEKGLYRRGWSKSLGWASQNEQVHPLERDRMRRIDTDGPRLPKGTQRAGDGLGNV